MINSTPFIPFWSQNFPSRWILNSERLGMNMFTVLIQFYFAMCRGLFASYILFVPVYLFLGRITKIKQFYFHKKIFEWNYKKNNFKCFKNTFSGLLNKLYNQVRQNVIQRNRKPSIL